MVAPIQTSQIFFCPSLKTAALLQASLSPSSTSWRIQQSSVNPLSICQSNFLFKTHLLQLVPVPYLVVATKRVKKSGPSQAPQSKRRNVSSLPRSPAHPASFATAYSAADYTLIATVQSLANFIQSIDTCLQSLDNASATATSSETLAATQASMLQPTSVSNQPFSSTPTQAAQHSLASQLLH